MGKKKGSSRTKNTILNFMTGFIGEIIIYVLSFITRTIFIRTLGKDYLGIGGLFANILELLSLTNLGMGVALNYRLYKPIKEGNERRLQILMRFYKNIYRVIGFVILIAGICLIPFLKFFINDYDKFARLGLNVVMVFLLYLMQSVSTYWLFAYKGAIVKASQKEYYLNIVGYIVSLANNITQIIVLITTHNYIVYIGCVILFNILQNIINAKIADRLFPCLKKPCNETLSKVEIKELFKDCGAISLFSLNSVVLKATDNLVLAAYIGLDIVGMYSNYLMVYNAIKKVVKKLIRAVQASLGDLFADADDKKKYFFFRIMSLVMLLTCGAGAVCIAILSDEFITVWIGHEFVIAMPFSILLALELYTIGLRLVLEQMRDVMGLFQKVKWRPILSMILNIVLSIVMVKKFGIYGVLIGTLLSEWLTVIVIDPHILFKYGFKGNYPVWEYYKQNGIYLLELFAIGMGNWLFKSYVFTGEGWIGFLLRSIVCGVSTLGCLMLINCRTREFKAISERGIAVIKLTIKKRSRTKKGEII